MEQSYGRLITGKYRQNKFGNCNIFILPFTHFGLNTFLIISAHEIIMIVRIIAAL